MARKPLLSGVLLVDKPKGMTSHDVVASVRRAFGQREVGHTGTLDPMATGLLVLALGRATRIARFIEATEKVYAGTVTLGRATTTYDAEGETTEEREIGTVSEAEVARVLLSLTKEIEQQVPAYSAVKVGGERLYKKARRNEAVELPTRIVTIHELVASSIDLPNLSIETRVSKGTYIRTLAVQIGEGLGLPAHLSALRRTRVGSHRVDAAQLPDDLKGTQEELLPMTDALAHLPTIQLNEQQYADVQHGRPLSRPEVSGLAEGCDVSLVGPDGDLAAVATVHPDRLKYQCVLVAG